MNLLILAGKPHINMVNFINNNWQSDSKKMQDHNSMSEKNTFEIIYDIIRQIPYGKVATYGQIAALAGNRRWARVVGYALHAIPQGSGIPWHRVVKKNGEVFGGAESAGGIYQTELLQKEGVGFTDGYVDMKKYQWNKVLF